MPRIKNGHFQVCQFFYLIDRRKKIPIAVIDTDGILLFQKLADILFVIFMIKKSNK